MGSNLTRSTKTKPNKHRLTKMLVRFRIAEDCGLSIWTDRAEELGRFTAREGVIDFFPDRSVQGGHFQVSGQRSPVSFSQALSRRVAAAYGQLKVIKGIGMEETCELPLTALRAVNCFCIAEEVTRSPFGVQTRPNLDSGQQFPDRAKLIDF